MAAANAVQEFYIRQLQDEEEKKRRESVKPTYNPALSLVPAPAPVDAPDDTPQPQYNPPPVDIPQQTPKVVTTAAPQVGEAKPVYAPADGLGPPGAPANDPDKMPAPGTPAYQAAMATSEPVKSGPMIRYDPHGVPVGADGGTRAENLRATLAAQEDYKVENHNSRLGGMGAGARRGFQRGGVMGGLIGLIRGGVDKTADERDALQERGGRTRYRLAEEMKLQDEDSLRRQRDAQTTKSLAGPVYEPKLVDTEEGKGVFNPNKPGDPLMPVYNPGGTSRAMPKPTGKPPVQSKVFNENGRMELYAVDKDGNKIEGQQLKVKDKNGNWVSGAADSSATAQENTAKALAGERDYHRQRDTKQDQEKATSRETKRKQAEVEAAAADSAYKDHAKNKQAADAEVSRLMQQIVDLGKPHLKDPNNPASEMVIDPISPDDPRRLAIQDQIRAAQQVSRDRQKDMNDAAKVRDKKKSQAIHDPKGYFTDNNDNEDQ